MPTKILQYMATDPDYVAEREFLAVVMDEAGEVHASCFASTQHEALAQAIEFGIAESVRTVRRIASDAVRRALGFPSSSRETRARAHG